MTLLFRISAAAVCALLAGLIIRRSNPEFALLLSLTALLVILLSSFGMLSGLQELREYLRKDFGLDEFYMTPILKCTAAGIVTRVSADLCRDASQTAAASAVELAGSLCALGILLPILMSMLRMVEDSL